MTDLPTIRSAAEAPAATPLVARLQGFILELLPFAEHPLMVVEATATVSTTTQAELHAALTAFHGATSYEYATRDLSSAMAYAIQRAKEANGG